MCSKLSTNEWNDFLKEIAGAKMGDYASEDSSPQKKEKENEPNNGNDDDDDNDNDEKEEWYELRDDDGELYYFNSLTGVSQWEPPRWFSEVDPVSGIKYFVNTSTGEPQWHLPPDFVNVVREEVYSTPEAEFVKNMLSPKRSFMRPKGHNGDQFAETDV